jgi:hypothetical protein
VALYDDMTAPPEARAQAKAASEPAPIQQRLVEQVEAIARRAGCASESRDRFIRESRERLEDRETWGDLCKRPFSEILDQICRDLGLTPDWAVLRYEPWAMEERQIGQVGRPLANSLPPKPHRPPIPEPAGASP